VEQNQTGQRRGSSGRSALSVTTAARRVSVYDFIGG
jgi:hypothetical protein